MGEIQAKSRARIILRSAWQQRPWVFRHTRKILFGFFVVCLFLNDQWVGTFGPAHIAIGILFALGCLGWAQERRKRKNKIRPAVPRRHHLFYWITGSYFLWRIAEARHNIFFLSDFPKIVLIVVAVAAFWLFDQSNFLFSFVCRIVPKMLALAIVLAIVQLTVSGEIFKERLAVTALGWGPELAWATAMTLGLHLYSLKQRPKMLLWYTVLTVLLVGQLFAFQKDGVIAAAIILAFFLHSTTTRREHASVRRRIVLGVCVFVPLLIILGIASLRIDMFSVGERFSVGNAETSLAGREITWRIWIDQAITENKSLFGVGLGALRPLNESTGFFPRDPESVYVGMFGDFGLVGLTLYCVLLALFWKRIMGQPDELRRALLQGMFWAYVAAGFTGSMWRHATITWYTAYMFYLFAFPGPQSAAVTKRRARVRSVVRSRAAMGLDTGGAVSV